MLAGFQTFDLKRLLGAFGQSTAGRKCELKDRALELLRSRSPGFNHAKFVSKIHEIYRSMPTVMPNNNAIMNHSLLKTQQRQMTGQIQSPQQRMYQPAPLYPQQPMHMTRGESPQVMPQIQRGIYCNSVGANTIANNNIQYTSGSYQPSGPRSITSSHLSSSQQMNVVSQDPLGYDMHGMTVGNNSYTPSHETVAQIKFKKIPFYEEIDVVLKPTLLAGTDICTLKNVPKSMNELEFKLFVSLKAINIVAISRDVSPGKQDYPYQFQIRISQLVEPMSNEVTDFMPLGLCIRLDGKICPLPPIVTTRPRAESRRSPRPIDCTRLIKLSPITPTMINIKWTPEQQNYVMSMYLVKRISSETLIQRLQDKGGRSSEETKKYIIEKLADVDPDLATTSYRFSLVCPLGKIRMKIPAKSIHCDHLQCFDASTFILMNEKKPTWMCPTCNKPCCYDDLQIENYFLEVVSSPNLEESIKEIEFLADGTWIVFEDNKKTQTTNSTFDANLKPVNFMNLDSDEEISVDLKVKHNPETAKHQKNVNLKFVDLTLSDDEEEPPKQKIKQEN
ncbi:E3 SUMO-protein ligase PIAS2-like [Metopolophium dirhodum]|uniref:E3 SUMO-protein ligase PIAS2-like n=1 Tax=Metopolophium dirhodum TaxID=44670 RepID=UPI002990605D|nr:E3 SUMO-protein ligase PIAS2-like [Metopolophium dirhodum]